MLVSKTWVVPVFILRTAQPQVSLVCLKFWDHFLGKAQGHLQGRKEPPDSCRAWEPGVRHFLMPCWSQQKLLKSALLSVEFLEYPGLHRQLGDQIGVDKAAMGWCGSGKAISI